MNRLLFEKTGNAVWISHLDLMRVFQRAFRRAGMLLKHSQGFTPHAYVSILLPLSVGVSSQCEILDYELDPSDTTATDVIVQRLNTVLPDGIRILSAYESAQKAGNLAYLKAAITMEYDAGNGEDCKDAICALFSQPELLVHKKTKRGEADLDIISMLQSFEITQHTPNELTAQVVVCAQNPSLNPQLLLTAIERDLPQQAPDFAKIHRLELYDKQNAVFR